MENAGEFEEDEDDASNDFDKIAPDNCDESDSSSEEESDKKPSVSSSKDKKHHPERQDKAEETVEQLPKDIAAMKIYLMKRDSSRKKCCNCQNNGHEAKACTSLQALSRSRRNQAACLLQLSTL